MKTYKIVFTGRLKNAIGIFYPVTEWAQAENEKEAVIGLYEKYDHVLFPKIEEVKS